MNRFFINCILFLIFAFAIYLVLLFVSGERLPLYLRKNLHYRIGDYGHMHSRMKDVKQVKNVDILFLGSSHAYRGFDVRIFEKNGYECFNLGSSGQTPVQTFWLLEKYLDRLQPRLVIFEVYPEVLCLDGVESAIDIISNEETDSYLIKMALEIHHVKTYNTLIYSCLRQLLGKDHDFEQPSREKKDLYISGTGFVARDMETFAYVSHPNSLWEFNTKQLKAFDKIIARLKSSGIDFLLVQAPLTNALYCSKLNQHTADSLYDSKGSHINFNNRLQLDDSLHFYDPDHLNQKGVEIFNVALINHLRHEKIKSR